MDFLFIISCYIFYSNFFEVIFYGIPNAVLFVIWARYSWNIFGYQFMSFYIICLYLKLKINVLNENILLMIEKKRFIRIRETLQSFDSLYSEINEYNTTFWSKFLFVFWLNFGSIVTILIYIVFCIDLPFIILLTFIYTMITFALLFLFIIFTASSVNYCANKSYNTLNSLYLSYSGISNFDRYPGPLKFKVLILVIIF